MAAPDPHEQAEILVHALPHMLRYDETIIVVKYGGHAMGANPHKLVYYRKPTQNHPIAHMHMAGKLRVICKDGVATDLTVVCQVHVGHDPVVITQSGDTQVTRGADVEGTKFSNGVARTDYQLTGLTLVLLILRNRTQGIELKDAVIFANCGVPLDHAMRANSRTRSNLDVRTNDRIGPH